MTAKRIPLTLYVERPDLEEWEYECNGCGHVIDADRDPSPAEAERICSGCFTWGGKAREQLEALETAVAAGPVPYDPEADTSLSPKTSPCPYCNDTGWVETRDYYSGEVTRTACYSAINHDKDKSA